MRALITRDFNARHPRKNIAIFLRADPKPQSKYPAWAVEQAIAHGCAEKVAPKRRKTTASGKAGSARTADTTQDTVPDGAPSPQADGET